MVVTMPPKLVWDSAIPALSAWLTNIFEVSRHLRDLHTLQLSLEVIIEACGFSPFDTAPSLLASHMPVYQPLHREKPRLFSRSLEQTPPQSPNDLGHSHCLRRPSKGIQMPYESQSLPP